MHTATRLPFLLLALCILAFAACKEEPIFYPKPRMYPKIEFPARKMSKFSADYCAFSFNYPDYMQFQQDTQFFDKGAAHSCWFNLTMPAFVGDIHFTYTDISAPTPEARAEKVYKVYKDAYRLSNEHDKKAILNEDLIINDPKRQLYGVLYNIDGHVASSFQFVMTDSIHHAVRASLYFRSVPNPDSMRPIIEFVKTDMMEIINSFEWKEGVKTK
jgi:gliding motility-associated lipoprotein GldD